MKTPFLFLTKKCDIDFYIAFFCQCPIFSSNTIESIKFHLEFAQVKRGSAGRPPFSSRNSPSNTTTNPNNVVQHQNMMRNHMDAITSMVMTEMPYPMIISGDRDGVIKVFA